LLRQNTDVDQQEADKQVEKDRRQTGLFAATAAAKTPVQINAR